MKLLLLAKVLALTLTTGNDLHVHAQEDSNNPVIHALRGSVFIQSDIKRVANLDSSYSKDMKALSFIEESGEEAQCLLPNALCDPEGEDDQCCRPNYYHCTNGGSGRRYFCGPIDDEQNNVSGEDFLLNEETEDAPCLQPGEKCNPANNQCCRGVCFASPWRPDDYICRE